MEMRHANGPCVYSYLNKISNLMARDIKMAGRGDMRKTAPLAAHDHISLWHVDAGEIDVKVCSPCCT